MKIKHLFEKGDWIINYGDGNSYQAKLTGYGNIFEIVIEMFKLILVKPEYK